MKYSSKATRLNQLKNSRLFVTLFWKTIHLGTCKICGNAQLKISAIFLKLTFFLHILIEQLLSLLAVKFHTHSFFILGDILNYIRPCSSFTMRGTAINLQIG